ncbi:MAG: hypothetical protein FWE24_07505 [Defluviitaleaceae bacterium]|nr:hypothetical protein [Defluviitaleaceae bacterium]
MKLIIKKLKYIIWAVLYAYGIFTITQIIYVNFAEGDILTATVLNMVLIIFFIIWEKVEMYILHKFQEQGEQGKPSLKKKIIIWYLDGPSFKSAMYFFYLVFIVCTAIMAADSELFANIPRSYVQSVQYGPLFLIAADKFIGQITKDIGARKE